jgi:hypothetical protein
MGSQSDNTGYMMKQWHLDHGRRQNMFGSKRQFALSTVLCVPALFVLCGALSAQTFSQVLSFQGRLCGTDGKPVPDGLYSVQFTIYDAAAGGNSLWQETQNVTQIGGVFMARLGSVSPFQPDTFADGDRWLAIKVGSDPEMAERFPFTPSPWALYAASSGPDNDWTISGSNIYRLAGNVGIGKSNPTTPLDVLGTAKVTGFQLTTGAANGYVLTSDAAGVATWRAPGGTNAWLLAGNAGTNPPADFLGTTDKQPLVIKTNATEVMRVDTAGRVGIGTTAPSYLLHVVGSGDRAVYGNVTGASGSGLFGEATNGSGSGYGVYGRSAGSNGIGVFGIAAATSGQVRGGWFTTPSTGGWGVMGYASATTGDTQGVRGEVDSTTGKGVYGYASAPSGYNYGVYGETRSNLGIGVFGMTQHSNGIGVGGINGNYRGYLGHSTAGVMGNCLDNWGYLGTPYYGVNGESLDGYGVRGYSQTDWGVVGLSPYNSGQAGVVGAIKQSNGGTLWVSNSGVSGTNTAGYGVAGRTISGVGVYGTQDDSGNKGYLATSSEGVLGTSVNGVGVSGTSTNGPAGHFEITNIDNESNAVDAYTHGTGSCVYAEQTLDHNDSPAVSGVHNVSDNYGVGVKGVGGYHGVEGRVFATGTSSYTGVYATATGGTGTCRGVYATATGGGTNYGVAGYASGGTTNIGVYGSTTGGGTNYAGYFSGNVTVTGTLSKGGGSFKIDHPLDPENKYLCHSFVESPDMMNVYNGNVVLDGAGEAWIELPEWFEALNRDFRYQLTCIGGFAPVYIAEEITDNRFGIAGGAPGMKVSWQVTGIRQDPYANTYRIPVEEMKPVDERGTYLHPELYGMPEERRAYPGLDPARDKTMVHD